ncbi:hypothetical protein [Micromonospora sp. URMC 103]|uniref:hypothetical protein n=1 Tax=Micromonospora sp. URMC 103 TaxID=3423406 RepID=UPI003F1D8237
MTDRRRAATAATALALAAAGATACGETPVSPLPVRPPGPTLAASPAAGPTSTAPPVPTPRPATSAAPAPTSGRPPPAPVPTRRPASRTPSVSPTGRPSACLGAVRYDLVLAETELALVRSLCFSPGGVLRIVGIGPGEVTVDREDLTSRSYEAGVVDVRFLRSGTVGVTIPRDGRAYTIAVVVT